MPAIHHIRKTKTRCTFIFASNRSEFFGAIVKRHEDPVSDEVEERFIVRYFFLKGLGNKRISAELHSTLHSSAIPNSTVKRWINKFETGDLSCDEYARPGRRTKILGQVLQKFLERYPFARAKVISRHFRISAATLKEILGREPGLNKFGRR
jgi:transposase